MGFLPGRFAGEFRENAMLEHLLLHYYCLRICPNHAMRALHFIPEKSTVSWNAVINGNSQVGQQHTAQALFDHSCDRNDLTWTFLIAGHAQNGHMEQAVVINLCSWNAIVQAYALSGLFETANLLFERMLGRSAVAYTDLLLSCCTNGKLIELKQLFDEMPHSKCMLMAYAQDKAKQTFNKAAQHDVVTMVLTFSYHGISGDLGTDAVGLGGPHELTALGRRFRLDEATNLFKNLVDHALLEDERILQNLAAGSWVLQNLVAVSHVLQNVVNNSKILTENLTQSDGYQQLDQVNGRATAR
ncbi:pentatricopeptide repeat-containing protein At4g02750 [Selaginella moellendorffii]|uniref:pentatricopeptide repeat-containing protein At4g02750 n=1 Tax=Selaginella moellendorffii TaxID=88036 RepID=UPI000D1C2811|nr:pentatricopeptide repeat-containing protein At4g02750 [Selaginella moellendorffii]|eukprot:XP_024521297.1 pentatricopeptide repeat-containing protein At4g02750 [Selaginella moellendorffii]